MLSTIDIERAAARLRRGLRVAHISELRIICGLRFFALFGDAHTPGLESYIREFIPPLAGALRKCNPREFLPKEMESSDKLIDLLKIAAAEENRSYYGIPGQALIWGSGEAVAGVMLSAIAGVVGGSFSAGEDGCPVGSAGGAGEDRGDVDGGDESVVCEKAVSGSDAVETELSGRGLVVGDSVHLGVGRAVAFWQREIRQWRAAFSGLTCREYSTPAVVHRGRITGQSSGPVRGWLIPRVAGGLSGSGSGGQVHSRVEKLGE